MSVLDRLFPKTEERYSFNDWAALMSSVYSDPSMYEIAQSWSPDQKTEAPSGTYNGHAARFTSNGPVYSLMAIRLRLFSQVRWAYQRLRSGRPGDLFSLPGLDLLNDDENLNASMIRDVDLAGNFYGVVEADQVCRLRPDWVQVASDRPLEDYDAEIKLYLYFPGGYMGDIDKGLPFLPSEVIHWMPEPDPQARWRGMSWLTPVVREIMSDAKMVSHKEKYLDNAATPNMVIKFDKDTSFENFEKFKDAFGEEHEGVRNAYKTLFLGGGADATIVGSNFQQLDFTAVSGKGETRLANAAGVHPVVVGFSEGMQGSSLNAGNFGQARRSTADSLLHPLWVSAAGAIGRVIPVPSDARLWYDARDIPFLREDAKDDAQIRQLDAGTIRQLVDAGYKPDSVVKAVEAGDWSLLEHTDLFSVQLQPAGTTSVPANGTTGRSTQLRLIRDEHEFIQGAEWLEA